MEFLANYFISFENFLKTKTTSAYFVLIASKTKIDLKKVMKNNDTNNIYGAIFPEIIFDNKIYSEGLVAIEIKSSLNIKLIKDMSKKNLLDKVNLDNVKSVLTILEGFSKDKDLFLKELFKNLNINTTIIGGGAGLIDNIDESVIFKGDKFYKNAAILISIKKEMTLSVKHGWEYLKGPFIVTSSKNSVLKKIDYRSAFEVYKEVIFEDCGIIINSENFNEISKNYPFGVVKYRDEDIVRDPIGFQGEKLILVGEISNNSVINILKGRSESLLNASREASKEILCNDCELIMMFDCITRKSFLGNKFEEELDSIYSQSSSKAFVGAITFGEIGNSGNNYINFLNKSCVIGGVC